MIEQLQGRRDIVPTVRTHNGFKHLTVLFPVRLPRVSWDWCLREPRQPRRPEGDCRSIQTQCDSHQNLSAVGSPPFPIPYSGNTIPRSHLHIEVVWTLVCLNTLPPAAYLRGPTRHRTIRLVGRKQGTLPWDIPPTVSVCNRLFGYPIDGWPTSRSTFAAWRLFCPLNE